MERQQITFHWSYYFTMVCHLGGTSTHTMQICHNIVLDNKKLSLLSPIDSTNCCCSSHVYDSKISVGKFHSQFIARKHLFTVIRILSMSSMLNYFILSSCAATNPWEKIYTTLSCSFWPPDDLAFNCCSNHQASLGVSPFLCWSIIKQWMHRYFRC